MDPLNQPGLSGLLGDSETCWALKRESHALNPFPHPTETSCMKLWTLCKAQHSKFVAIQKEALPIVQNGFPATRPLFGAQ